MQILKTVLAAGAAAALLAGSALAQGKPSELKIGITTFLSGPASVFGVPAKAAAEMIAEDLNKKGGIGGVPGGHELLQCQIVLVDLGPRLHPVLGTGLARWLM